MSDSVTLLKFVGLVQSGLSCDKAILQLGELPNNPGLRFFLEVARETGSAVNYQISQIANQYRFQEQALERIEVLKAGPSSSTKLMIWLPVIVLGLAQLSGFDVLGLFQTRPSVLYLIAGGLFLLAIAQLVARSLVRRATPSYSYAGLYLMGLAMNSAAGGSLNQMQNRCSDIYSKVLGTSPPDQELFLVAEAIQLVEATGAPVASLLLSQAEILQREEMTRAETKIERLSVRLVIPLGIFVLPAFLLIAILPISFSMLGFK